MQDWGKALVRGTGLGLVLSLTACGSGDSAADAPAEGGGGQTPPSIADGVWMKGDLHLHSHHSTDATSPLSDLVVAAEQVGMDYFLLTDHDNHVDGDIAGNTWSDPDYQSESMVMLYGAEWTTHRGHGNAISARPYDHQRLYDVRDDLDVVIGKVVDDLGIHFTACHPAGSDAFNFSYDLVDGIEVWNSSVWLLHSGAVQIWDDLLKSGRRVTARGGSDAHHGPVTGQGFVNALGTPTTWVYAQDYTADGVVDALDAGRASVSVNPNSERLAFYADIDQDGEMDLMMGDGAKATGTPVTFRLQLEGGQTALPIYSVTVIKNGAEFGSYSMTGDSLEFTDTPATDERSYYRVEVQGAPSPYLQAPLSPVLSTGMLALSNPIYFNFGAH